MPLWMRFLPVIATVVLAPVLSAEAPTAPRRSPEFQLNFVGGEQKLLSSYRGKVVMIEFLHTTCPHCQHASQVFSKLYTEFGSRGFQPLGVAWNDMANMLVPDFIKANHVNYPVAFATREAVMDYLMMSPVVRSVVPQIVWIDRKGMIRSQTPAIGDDAKLLTEKYWREMIETLTSESDTSARKASSPHRAAVRKPAS
ncbi:MAG: TlpA family protein disulfide reductase [Acidobacteriota bacterium]|nr:TlpA family protein disulfide reductase [Acidobacteriota bacterium]